MGWVKRIDIRGDVNVLVVGEVGGGEKVCSGVYGRCADGLVSADIFREHIPVAVNVIPKRLLPCLI